MVVRTRVRAQKLADIICIIFLTIEFRVRISLKISYRCEGADTSIRVHEYVLVQQRSDENFVEIEEKTKR